MNLLKPISFSSIVLVTLLCLTVGCQSLQPTEVPPPPATAQPQDHLSVWLANAEAPTVISCSVDRSVAPVVVDRFTEISQHISALYSSIYTEAQETASAQAAGNVMSDSVLAKVTENVTTATAGANWKSAAQEVVIANYQTTLKAINDQGHALSDYTSSLRSDTAITNLTNKTAILLEIGRDTMKLSNQLKAAAEGASAIRIRRISTALGK